MVNQYKPFLDAIDLTYTKYITMMVLWDKQKINVKDLGLCLHLDSGTLTPLLKKLESKGYVRRERSEQDERVVNINITREGERLKTRAVEIPGQIVNCLSLSQVEAETLYMLLYKVIHSVECKDNNK